MSDLKMGSAFAHILVLDPGASAFLAWFALGSVGRVTRPALSALRHRVL